MSLKPTKEQEDIIQTTLAGDSLVIQARAGAAKTTTCTMIAESLVKPSLYLTFNKAMQQEAEEKMPPHVEVRTWHSLAFRSVGSKYKKKLKRPFGKYQNVCGTASEIAKFFHINPIRWKDKVMSPIAIGASINKTILNFEQSDSKEIDHTHVSFDYVDAKDGFPVKGFIELVEKVAKELWDMKVDIKSPMIIGHDTYLKLFQLSSPKLDGYSVIYSDESQDSSMTMIDILKQQKGVQTIVVGDSRQAIYQWRGSVDAMKIVDGVEKTLTQSFRFGNKVGEIASLLIESKVEGWKQLSTTTQENDLTQSEYKGKTLLFRRNMTLLGTYADLLDSGYSVGLEVDAKDLSYMLNSAVALNKGDMDKVKHDELIPYSSWEEFERECKDGNNLGLAQIKRLIDTKQVYRVLGAIREYDNPANPDIILTTAHKSKGREWDNVVLMGDFGSPLDEDGNWVGLTEEETNLLYVACTRAKKSLWYNDTVKKFIENKI